MDADERKALIAEVRRISDAATDGPWSKSETATLKGIVGPNKKRICFNNRNVPLADENNDLISCYRRAAPALADECEHLEARVRELEAVIAQHDLCHDLHGKVNARQFADGCAAEQRREYGCAPDADRIRELEAEVKRLRDELCEIETPQDEHETPAYIAAVKHKFGEHKATMQLLGMFERATVRVRELEAALGQYARFDYYLFLLDPIGQQTDPTAVARAALNPRKEQT